MGTVLNRIKPTFGTGQVLHTHVRTHTHTPPIESVPFSVLCTMPSELTGFFPHSAGKNRNTNQPGFPFLMLGQKILSCKLGQ